MVVVMGGLPLTEQRPFIIEGGFAEACFTPDKVRFDKPQIIHCGQLLGTLDFPFMMTASSLEEN